MIIKRGGKHTKKPKDKLPTGPTVRAVTYKEWSEATKKGRSSISQLLADSVAPIPVPFHSWPIPCHHRKLQERAQHAPVPKAAIHVCYFCRSGLFVGHSVGGKKCEALGESLNVLLLK